MPFKKNETRSALKKLIKLLETPPESGTPEKIKSMERLRTGLGSAPLGPRNSGSAAPGAGDCDDDQVPEWTWLSEGRAANTVAGRVAEPTGPMLTAASALKELIKLLETAPDSGTGAKIKSLERLKAGLGSPGKRAPVSGIGFFRLISALSGILTLMETHKIKPDYTINFSFARLRSSLSFLEAEKKPEALAENAAAHRELALAKKQINSEKTDFINAVKFDSIYSELSAIFDAADGLSETPKKEKQ